ncbi:MAG: DUF4468 domain-containing protein [Bacteroidota bacterium]|nr:DUF4468 domain-containing protein [Bacteroidota bacterium]
MKKIFFLFITVFISNQIFAQDKLLGILPLKDGKVTYTNIIPYHGVTREEMYDRVKLWFINTYNSGKDVIQLDDKEHGEIIGKGCFRTVWNLRFYTAQSLNIWKTIRIQLKNDCLRYEITDFRLNNIYYPAQNASISDLNIPLEEWNKGHNANNRRFYPKINERMIALINSLEKAMKTKINDIW